MSGLPAPINYKVTVGLRKYVAAKAKWIDLGEVDCEPGMVARFVAGLKRLGVNVPRDES